MGKCSPYYVLFIVFFVSLIFILLYIFFFYFEKCLLFSTKIQTYFKIAFLPEVIIC